MTFHYRPQLRGGEVRYLPLVPIEVYGPQSHVRVQALVDSGAEHTLFPLEIAERLSLPYHGSPQVSIQGVTGPTAVGYRVPLELSVGAHRWTTQAICIDGLETKSGLLGQLGFFEFFTVTFQYQRKLITLRRAPRIP